MKTKKGTQRDPSRAIVKDDNHEQAQGHCQRLASRAESQGRDELNLAEFPLATLADRAPPGCKTLVFEDRIWDKGRGKEITRRLTVSASDRYGLPTALDDEVIVGLIQLSKLAGFGNRQVNFSRYLLIQLLGWRDEGKSYLRLEESLKRWLGVTLYYENAWWDKAQRKWVDESFHLLEHVVLYRRSSGRGLRSRARERAISSFTWNDIVFRSFQAGYLKRLDLDLYRKLKSAIAKRMYRFLDKRFFFGDRLQFDLARLAYEHIGLSRHYDLGQVKRRLAPAIKELEAVGFLEQMTDEDRYLRVKRGKWQATFVRKRMTTETSVRRAGAAPIRRRGPTRGSQPPVSRESVAKKGSARQADRSRRQGFHDSKHAVAVDRERKRIEEFLSKLSSAELKELEQQALEAAPAITAAGYRRAERSGNTKLAEEYRQHILERYMRSIRMPR